MRDWAEIRKWRRETRAGLLSRRTALSRAERDSLRDRVADLVWRQVPELRAARLGFYWPFKAEIDLRPLVRDCIAAGASAALPVVTAKAQPMEFWAWRPRAKLGRGIWNIPIPAERRVVQPTALLVPLVGFDAAGYRLGYGGGYYDRTLAAMPSRPLTIAVGCELGRLRTIHPQPHDIPMDAIVTERGIAWFRRHGRPLAEAGRADAAADGGAYASPACDMAQADPAYFGYLPREALLDLLNRLLEAERAGARAVQEMARQAADADRGAALREIAGDEARFCAMLSRQIARLDGTPSRATGAFYDKILALDGEAARLDLLDRGQGWVVRKLREALPRIADDALHAELRDMLAVHERNIARCAGL